MEIEFTDHAMERFVRARRFKITKDQVISIIENPDKIEKTEEGRMIAQKIINGKHILRVIYEERYGIRYVITFYPARRSRYESKIQ